SPKHLNGKHITPHPNIEKPLKIKQTQLLINLGCFRQIKSLYFRHTSFLLFIIYDLFFDFLLEVKIPAIPEAKATKPPKIQLKVDVAVSGSKLPSSSSSSVSSIVTEAYFQTLLHLPLIGF